MEMIILKDQQLGKLKKVVGALICRNSEKLDEIIQKALSLTEVPEEEKLPMESTAKSLEESVLNFWEAEEGSTEEKAAIRKTIKLINSKEDFRSVHRNAMVSIENSESFEAMLAIRKAAQIMFSTN